jgi:hypothetical protein
MTRKISSLDSSHAVSGIFGLYLTRNGDTVAALSFSALSAAFPRGSNRDATPEPQHLGFRVSQTGESR